MKNTIKKLQKSNSPRLKWLWILLVQIISMFALYALMSLSLWLGSFLHGVCLWVLMPIAGLISACMATRKGLLNYIAWLIPPAAQVFSNLLLWGYSPSVAPVFVCGFLSLVGAAAGEVLKRQHKSKGADKWKKT